MKFKREMKYSFELNLNQPNMWQNSPVSFPFIFPLYHFFFLVCFFVRCFVGFLTYSFLSFLFIISPLFLSSCLCFSLFFSFLLTQLSTRTLLLIFHQCSMCSKFLNLSFYCLLFFLLSFKGVTKKKFQICIIDHAGYGNQRSDVVIDYLIIGGQAENPCLVLETIQICT